MSLTTDAPPYLLELQKKFTNIEDINDPTLMDDILTCLENIQAQDEEFLQALLHKLPEMTITWDQPWYQRTSCLTRPLKVLGSHDSEDTYKSDTICSEESNKIHKNWKKFVKIFDVPNMPECLARWRNKDRSRHPTSAEERVRRFVIAFLAQGLERTLYQVYKHVVIRYGSPVKGPYLQYEENIMDICLHHCSQNCVPDLSAVLGREPRGLYKRLLQKINVSGKRERKKLSWTLQLATKFLISLMKYSNETFENLKNKRFEKTVWLKLEEEFDQNYAYLQLFWYRSLHVQLFVNYDVKIRKLRKNLFKRIKLYPYRVWGDIRWKQILTEYPDGFTHLFLYCACFNLIKTYPDYRKSPLQDVLNYGLQKTKSIPNKRLKTLKLNEKQELEIVKYDNKLFK